jgi:HD-like signal output (HDOD) protein
MSLEEDFLNLLLDAIKTDRLVLPTLPEVALRIREAVEDEDVSAQALADVIASDAALSARLIKVANSPLLRGRVVVDNLQMGITRLGITFVRNLATGLAMEQMFQATSEYVDARMRASWEHSIEVASISHVLAKHYAGLKPDQATLAGLTHEIGILPILTIAEENPALLEDEEMLDRIITQLHPQIGAAILKAWEFPEELQNVPMDYVNFGRQHDGPADYGDVVCVANLQSYAGTDHPFASINWDEVPSFARLGLATDVEVQEVEGIAEDIEEARALFS